MQACSKCKSEKPDEAFARNKAKASGFNSYCRTCMAEYGRNNRKQKRIANNKHYARNKTYYYFKRAARRATLHLAIPKWADLEEIKKIYAEAGRLNADGKQVHVDHVVPLKHPLVCGLHTPANLEIISAQANWSKNNRHWPDMPDLC